MSRSEKGSKSPGFDYWTKRPGNRHGQGYGKARKKYTHRVERSQGKKEARDEG